MARIADDELERLKAEVDLAELVRGHGVELKEEGADLVGLCPLHDDKTASFHVTPGKNLFHCFGCGAAGSVVDWVMATGKVSFRHAVEILREKKAGGPVRKTVRVLTSPVHPGAEDQQALDDVTAYYHATLKESPEALRYLEERGLSDGQLVDAFKLGFANRTLGLRLPRADRAAGAEIRTRLQELGVLRETGHEQFNGCVTFPILDEDGHTVGMYGRKIGSNLGAGLARHLYLKGPHRGLFNVRALSASTEMVVCEAIIDALTFWCAGIRNVTSAFGVEGFTDEMMATFKKHGVKRALIAFDRDDAGDRGAQKLGERLMAEGVECFRVQFPWGMDANEYALKEKPAQQSLKLVMRKAVWMGKGVAPEREVSVADVVAMAQAAATPTSPALEAPATALTEPPPPAAEPVTTTAQPTTTPPATEPVATTSRLPLRLLQGEGQGELKADEMTIPLGDRRYRVRGWKANSSTMVLKVNITARRGTAFYVDTLDMNVGRARQSFIRQAALELDVEEVVVKADLGKLHEALEQLLEASLNKQLEVKKPEVVLTDEERAEALAFLRSPQLLERIVRDFERCGLVGEEKNKLVAYLAAVSRKLRRPLAIMVQSNSAAGKSSLMEAVLAFMPEEERSKYSALTGQALYYMGENELVHKILAVVEEAGSEPASYALKLLQSEGELHIASTGKDGSSGRLETKEYHVQGPVALFITTTKVELDAELENRCITLDVDESREQTRAIHRVQRERRTVEGLFVNEEREELLKLHQNAQRLLKPMAVVNPYAHSLTFLDEKTRARRDHEKYLSLIESLALLRQYQRPVKTQRRKGVEREFIEVTLDDIAVANQLASDVLGRTLDELGAQTRKFLYALEEMVERERGKLKLERSEYRFGRREIIDVTGWSYEQVRVHLGRLIEREYVLVHRGMRGQSYVYELIYDGGGKDGSKFLIGLVNVEGLGTNRGTSGSLGG